MLAELERDLVDGSLYLSQRLTVQGQNEYPALLRQAIESGTDETLAHELRASGRLKESRPRRTPSGGLTVADVPWDAADTLAEGEFNRLYIRALCLRAIEDNIPELIAYRAKPVTDPRPESEAIVGQAFQPPALLDDLRTHQGRTPALGMPPGPNSGLSVRLPSRT
jgi:hypothetical protein